MENNKEYHLKDNEIIVSKTCPKGRITYANRPFMEISGYAEPQLLTRPHNIIRHPDMPRGVYHLLWNTLQQGKEFFGYVKNSTADGGFYWVFANITPDWHSDGSLAGYFSVRRRPNYASLPQVEAWYQHMKNLEAGCSASQAPKESSSWLIEQAKQQGLAYNQFILNLEK